MKRTSGSLIITLTVSGVLFVAGMALAQGGTDPFGGGGSSASVTGSSAPAAGASGNALASNINALVSSIIPAVTNIWAWIMFLVEAIVWWGLTCLIASQLYKHGQPESAPVAVRHASACAALACAVLSLACPFLHLGWLWLNYWVPTIFFFILALTFVGVAASHRPRRSA